MGDMAKFLSAAGRRTVARLFNPLAARLVKWGISPNTVTVLGTVGVVAGSVLLVTRGELGWGLVVITVAVLTDLLDGAMARMKNDTSRFGALLDSTMDRLADGAILGSLAFWLAVTEDYTTMVGVGVALIAGQTVSYVKARAEGLGFACDVGIAERAERLVILGVGGLLYVFSVPYGLPVAVWVLAAVSVFTVFQRLLHVRSQTNGTSV